ncbi:MAG: tetratricopeptide repeat protein, partial [Caldilineaceae bacterium]
MRQFAAEKLAADPPWQATVRQAHARFFMERLAQAPRPTLHRRRSRDDAGAGRRARISSRRGRGAWSRRDRPPGGQCAPLCVLCDLRVVAKAKTCYWLLPPRCHGTPAPVLPLARLQARQAVMLFRQSRYAEADALAGDALARLTTLNAVDLTDPAPVSHDAADVLAEIAFAEKTLGNIAYLRGDTHAALPLYRQSLAHARRLGRPIETAQALSNLGMTLRVLGGEERFVEAERMLRESLTLRCDAGDLVGASVTLANLGGLAAQQNHWDEAQRHYLDVLDMRRRMDDRAGIVRALDGLANSAYNLGDYATSCAWAEEGEQLSRRLHDMETLSRHLILKGRALCAMGRYHAAQAP